MPELKLRLYGWLCNQVSEYHKIEIITIPTSSEALSAPMVRKKEYIVMVSMKTNRKLMKNWDAVLERLDMLKWWSAWDQQWLRKGRIQIYYKLENGNLNKYDRRIDDHLSQGIC